MANLPLTLPVRLDVATVESARRLARRQDRPVSWLLRKFITEKIGEIEANDQTCQHQ